MRKIGAVLAGMAICFLGIMAFAQEAKQNNDAAVAAGNGQAYVDVVVTDRKGNYTPSLTAENFRLWEGGAERKIASVQTGGAGEERMVLFFDGMIFSDQTRAQDAAARFLQDSKNVSMPVEILHYEDYGELRTVQSFTKDGAALQRALHSAFTSSERARLLNHWIRLAHGGAIVEAPSWSADTDEYFKALRKLTAELGALPGHKTLVLLSPGIVIARDQLDEVDRLSELCNRANVTVHVVDVNNNIAGGLLFFTNLEPLARQTGGLVLTSPSDLSGELAKIGSERLHEYLLSYTSAAPAGQCSKLKVTVTHADVRVRNQYCNTQPAAQ
jgi:VWFA-related protein